MKKEIKDILQELYDLDVNLKKKEVELVKIINQMMDSKPDIKINKQFKSELKQKVLQELEKKTPWLSLLHIGKSLWLFTSGAVAVMLVVNIFPILNPETAPTKQEEVLVQQDLWEDRLELSFVSTIDKLEESNVFGTLQFQDQEVRWVGWWGGIGGWGTTITESRSTSVMVPRYIPKIYEYTLKDGEKLPEIPEKMYVYKKEQNSISFNQSNINKIFATDSIDISKFQKLWLSNVNLYEWIDQGYNINMSLQDGNINIYRNHDSWPMIDYQNQQKLSIEDIPNENLIVSVANEFAKKYSIDTSIYSAGIIQNSWKKYYENSNDKENFYIPEIMSVTYPFILDNTQVFDTTWNPYWLKATVNIRDMKINSFGPIETMNLKGSNYALFNDEQKILETLKKWNYHVNPVIRGNEESEIIPVDVWEVRLVYIIKNIYDAKNNMSKEYFVPGLLFKVLTQYDTEKMIYPWEYITVPLVWWYTDYIDALPIEE